MIGRGVETASRQGNSPGEYTPYNRASRASAPQPAGFRSPRLDGGGAPAVSLDAGAVVGLFLVTETAAHPAVVAALRPLSFHTVATNILFAIGFGSPIVLYLSGLPPPREALGAVVASRRM